MFYLDVAPQVFARSYQGYVLASSSIAVNISVDYLWILVVDQITD